MAEILYHPANLDVLANLIDERFDTKEWFDLRLEAESLSLSRGFERLLSLEELPVRLFDHQRRAVLRVLRDLRGRAILADEVGLGKTIEAGVIVREYLLRGLAHRILILVPATLVGQWRSELANKLGLAFQEGRGAVHWSRCDRIVASLDTAKRPERAQAILDSPWDMVIVDEAHRLKNQTTRNWKFVNAIQKKYLLLLTATPVQNDLRELYNLVTLLKPGQLKTYSHFKREFTIDRHSPKNVQRLRERLSEVMVRTARRETMLRFPRREVRSMGVPLVAAERTFYNELVYLLRRAYQAMPQRKRNVLPFILILREATSHPVAAARTLRAMERRGTLGQLDRAAVDHLFGLAQTFQPGKFAALVPLMTKETSHRVIFTSFKETAVRLADQLPGTVTLFHGGLSADEKSAAVERFRKRGGVFVSTEAGGEGMNLQFCHSLINYDLPWNPLRLEQRIGRVHRLGQERDVEIYNLATEGTIESYILFLLEKKIAMFHKVVGELEGILANVNGEFEWRLADAFLQSENDHDVAERLERFGDELHEAVRLYDRQQRLTSRLFDALPPELGQPLNQDEKGGA